MSSSPARTSPSSSVCVTHGAGTESPSSNHPQVPGNLAAPPRKPNPSSVKPTVSTISQTPKKPSSGCMPSVVSQSSQRGSKQYRLATHWLAPPHRQEHPKVLPRNYRNFQRPHVTDTQKCPIHQTQALRNHQLRLTPWQETP